MKQKITPEQLQELSPISFLKIEKWKVDKGYRGFPYYEGGKLVHKDTLSIGQMIEFLDEKDVVVDITRTWNGDNIKSLADDLWGVTKEVLES